MHVPMHILNVGEGTGSQDQEQMEETMVDPSFTRNKDEVGISLSELSGRMIGILVLVCWVSF